MTHYTIKELRAKMSVGQTLTLKKDDTCKSLNRYPNAGPHASITDMRKFHWGKYAKIVKHKGYIYCIEW